MEAPSSKNDTTTSGAPRADYRRYVDPNDDFDAKEMAYSFWFVRHKVMLYRLLVGVLFVFDLVTGIYGLGGLVIYGALGIAQDNQLLAALTVPANYGVINQHFAPAPLQISSSLIVPDGTSAMDAISTVGNPNKHFIATIHYSFVSGNAKTPVQDLTILPGQTQLAAVLGQTSLGDGQIVAQSVDWQRLSPHRFGNPLGYQSDRLNFEVVSTTFTPSDVNVALSHVNRIQFNLTNDSAYSYSNPSFMVGLYDSGNLVGVIPYSVSQFVAQETKAVDLRSFTPELSVTDVQVYPLINVYDPSVYVSLPH